MQWGSTQKQAQLVRHLFKILTIFCHIFIQNSGDGNDTQLYVKKIGIYPNPTSQYANG